MAEVDFPPFLRVCENFPVPADEKYAPFERTSFELAVSFETLVLETKDAAELLFGFLLDPQTPGRKNRSNMRKHIWLSHNIFITNYETDCICSLNIKAGGELDDDKPPTSYVCICITPSADLEQQRVVMDTCLRLVAKHKTITHLLMNRHYEITGPFPASLDTLKALVSEAQSPRKLLLPERIGFSVDQWRVVNCNCNKTVQICYLVSENYHPSMETLIDAMKRNQCPAQLSVRLDGMYHPEEEETFRIVSALETTNSLNYLELRGIYPMGTLVPYCGAIAKNHGLQRLKLEVYVQSEGWTLTDTEWEYICSVIASHPTLKTIKFHGGFKKSTRSRERDQIFIDHVSHNSVLCDFTYNSEGLFHDPNHVEQLLRPILNVNRFRTVVQAIKQAADLTERQHFFTSIIRSGTVTKCSAIRFLLLKENPDLMVEFLDGQTTIGCSQHAGIVPLLHGDLANKPKM